MKTKLLLTIVLLLPFLFVSNNPTLAAPTGEETNVVTYTYTANDPPPEVIALRSTRLGSPTDSSMQGTAWQPQFKGHFNWAVKSTGVETNAATGYGNTYQWVHIAIPDPVHVLNAVNKVYIVEFCATADHPTRTKPTKVEIWGFNAWEHVKLYTGTVTWPDATTIACSMTFFSPTVATESLGVSVLVKYANTTDILELNMAWARFEP